VMEEVVTCKHMEEVVMVVVGVVTCKHMVEEEVETCKYKVEEVMEMAVGVIYIHKEEVAVEEISMAEEVSYTNMVDVPHALVAMVVTVFGGGVVAVRHKCKAHWPPQ